MKYDLSESEAKHILIVKKGGAPFYDNILVAITCIRILEFL